MKFSKDRIVLDRIEALRMYACNLFKSCECCKLYYKNNGRKLGCIHFLHSNPLEAAALLGFEVIDDKTDSVVETPFDIGNMTLAQAIEYCSKWAHEHGYPCEKTGCELRRRHICMDWVHEWDFDRLTPNELEICKALGAKYVTRSENGLCTELWSTAPMKRRDDDEKVYFVACGIGPIANTDHSLFPSVKPGDCINVEELIGGEIDG